MAANRLVIEALLKGEKGVKSGLKGIVTGLLSIAGAMKAIQTGARFVNAAADEFVAWESAMANANRMLQIEDHQLDVLKQRLLAATGPLQNVANLHEQLPDAMYRMASAGEDEVHMFEDLQDIAGLAAMAHEDLGETADNVMGIMRAFNLVNGEANTVIRILVGAEQAAIAKSGELAQAIRELAPAFNVTGESAEVTAAAIAAVTKAGFSANMAATALKTGWAKMQTEEVRRKLAALGVEITDFTGTMQQIKDVGLTAEDWVNILGVRQYSKFAGLIAHWDDFNDAIEKTKTAEVGDMFDAFAATASAAGNRIENEFNRRLIEIGERAEPARRELTMFANELKLAGTEMAAWALKNKDAVIAIALGVAGAITIIKTALGKGGPLGLVLGAIELLIGFFVGLGDILTRDTREILDFTRGMQELNEKSIAQVQTAKEQVKAELEAAQARKVGKFAAAGLADELDNLREKEQALIKEQSALAQSTLQLESALLAEKAAEEIGAGVVGEQTLARYLKGWQARLNTAEKVREEEERLTELQLNLYAATGDEVKQRQLLVEYLGETTDLTEEQASALAESSLSLEEMLFFLDAQSGALANATTKLREQERIRFQNLRYDYERLGILEDINALNEGTLDLEEDELAVLVSQLEVELDRLVATYNNMRIQGEQLAAWAAAGFVSDKDVEAFRYAAETVKLSIDETISNIKEVGSLSDRLWGDGDGRAPAAAGAADAQSYWRGWEGVTQEELERLIEQRVKAEDETQRRLTEAAIAAMRDRLAKLRAIIEADEEEEIARKKSLAADLAGVFRGAFTDEAWNFWDSFESLGLRALDALLQYAILSGLFSLFGLGAAEKPGGLAGGILDLLGFAEGGYVTQPTFAMMGERGPEFAIPRADMLAAMAGGMGAVENLLSRLSGRTITGPAPSGAQVASIGSTTTIQNIFNAPAIGSLDKLDEYNQHASAGPKDY